MADSVKESVATSTTDTEKQSDKEINFSRLREKAELAEKRAESERLERERLVKEIERLTAEREYLSRNKPHEEDEEDDDEPYVDKRRLKKELSKFRNEVNELAEKKAKALLEEEKKKNYLYRLRNEYPDFDQVMTQDSIDKFTSSSPAYAERIMKNPDDFERRELAYHAIKSMNLHKKEDPKSSMQDIVNQNQMNPYYIPSSAASPGSKLSGDFSPAGRKAAYEKMKELQSRFGGA